MKALGWTEWNHGRLGFSYNRRGIKADMAPSKDRRGLINWTAVAWRGDDKSNRLLLATGDTHLECARAFAIGLEELGTR